MVRLERRLVEARVVLSEAIFTVAPALIVSVPPVEEVEPRMEVAVSMLPACTVVLPAVS